MLVTVTPKVEAGTDRGGEDLFLVFETVGDYNDTFTVETRPGDPSWDCNGNGNEDDPYALWSCYTEHYEFSWEGTLLDLHALAVKVGVTNGNDWEWYGPVNEPPKRRFQFEHFVAGNAE
jgi:hypothetical protein